MNFHVDHIDGRLAYIKKHPYLYFGGTSYLGIPYLTGFKETLKSNLDYYGSSYGSSRHSNFRLELYEEAETYLASWTGSERSLTLSSGYLAGQMLSTLLQEGGHSFFYAPGSHSAMHQGSEKAFSTWEELLRALNRFVGQGYEEPPVLFMDTMDLTGAGYPDFPYLQQLPLDKIILVLDDSHGLGVLGTEGSGMYKAATALNPWELIVCASLNKAMGIPGGIILGNLDRITSLRNTTFFSGASPVPPAYLATLMSSTGLYREQYNKLQQLLTYFESLSLPDDLFQRLPAHPVFAFKDKSLTEYLYRNEILVTDFNYAGSGSEYTGRMVINANHRIGDLEKLAVCLQKHYK
ncbi:aminotransferase class I/II-fold pyridoxal phosphate-dependent enzyme [Zeaxanthinibacter sp. PT1]|uniref:aminotransferase class I/II-fold pyridoxal phosphate-dependent enzyme n=1 Tax=Zeaxanthinibacter TaxID=561554 RepID=UPI00234AD6BC|nr:aminotransferase class I/II-fold pyridoxal phosphate-dependent enzyme [Zeaxanthinibacter sp. PT1]MDC6352230.1 aminotransferase class I/II-fold pyridoxal phosphate-dependent enzyme [Zeaxanthinibacter sp. PT1]